MVLCWPRPTHAAPRSLGGNRSEVDCKSNMKYLSTLGGMAHYIGNTIKGYCRDRGKLAQQHRARDSRSKNKNNSQRTQSRDSRWQYGWKLQHGFEGLFLSCSHAKLRRRRLSTLYFPTTFIEWVSFSPVIERPLQYGWKLQYGFAGSFLSCSQ